MPQRNIKNSTTIRSVEQLSADRFVFLKFFMVAVICFCMSLFSCGEPAIKLNRADKRMIDTLVNYQLDSISPILDSICLADKEKFIQQAADSIMQERKKREERLRLKSSSEN